jgi:3-dehydroquinate synthase
MNETLKVSLGTRSYDIAIGEKLITRAGDMIAPLLQRKHVIILTDQNVAPLYLHALSSSLARQQIRYHPIVLAPGETTKSFAAFPQIMDTILEQNPERGTMLLALGGGVIGDITGFAASILLRGVDFVQIPTTMLAQIDSSVGGKTGANAAYGKNVIGTFYQPKLVVADVSTLGSLPRRELLAGYAEMVKYGLINQPTFFQWLEQHGGQLLDGNTDLRIQAIRQCCQFKADIVAADETEKSDLRALLNLGHTFAHALEAETGFSQELLHGEAVAIGMVMAFKLSSALGLCPAQDALRVEAHLAAAGLPASPNVIQPRWNIDRLMEHIAHDKKVKDGRMTFILARGIGKAFVTQDVPEDKVRALLAEQCGI